MLTLKEYSEFGAQTKARAESYLKAMYRNQVQRKRSLKYFSFYSLTMSQIIIKLCFNEYHA